MADPFSILNVLGPYREPHEPALSYDYSIQRPSWPTAHAVRIKVSLAAELDYLKTTVLGLSGGTPGQQLRINQLLTKRIADRKLQIANEEGMFSQRLDVKIDPFTGPFAHLFARLETWMQENKAALREEVRQAVGL
ncbi:MAG: hypothetical protein KGO52_08010 [Nitrospirota bacterium]|nr:hypothetical protein [Nitrospirota bacterium]MDE3118258.1 hypothetical protein [Nitrospirota bacterium]MDE3225852.1 hypothetical protein [Nitrospirota bacterium]MDE3242643.1 hypothetical protein [Nitrospirota bacterium]